MKKSTLFLFFFLSFIPYASAIEEYSLDDLYNLALKRSEIIKISEEDIYISERDKDRAMAVLIPKFSAFGSHTEYTSEKQGTSSVIQPDSSTSWGLKLNQSLSLSGRELTALKIAKETIVKTRVDLENVKEAYLLNVATAYYDLLKANKALEIANANVERLTKYRDAAKIRLKVGEITKTVLLRAEAELSGSQSELIKAENSLKFAKIVLARIAGIGGDYNVRETDPKIINESPLQDCLQHDIGCFKKTALLERYELKSVELQKQIAVEQIKYTEGTYWPDLAIEGVYSRKEDRPELISTNKESSYGILRIDFPFYEGGLRKAEVRQAEARLRQAEYRLADLKNSINVEVENAHLNLLTLSGVLEKLQAESAYAADNYNSVSKQFEYGLANSIDVMDANTLLVTSERELANAKYDYQLALLRLKSATGTLLKSVGANGRSPAQ